MTPVSGGGRLDSAVDTLWLIIPFLVSVLPSQRDGEPFAIRRGEMGQIVKLCQPVLYRTIKDGRIVELLT